MSVVVQMEWAYANANKRDQAAGLEDLAAEHGLRFDPDGWCYPAFRDAAGRAVVMRCSDFRWRGAGWQNEPSWATAAEALSAWRRGHPR